MPEEGAFSAYWLAESLRLREAHWGPLEDAAEVRRARAASREFTEQILLRAQYLGRREKLDLVIKKWMQGGRLALIAMLAAALLTGASAALAALGDGTRPVNLLLALVAMLGLHGLTFILWLLSFAIKNHSGGAWLGQAWLWLTQKLARGPDNALAPRALISLLSRHGALRWVLGSISHGLWTGAFLSLLATLLAVLAARRYGFNWETTLLSADTFVHLTAWIGWLPAQLGFAMPSASIVRASDGLHTLPESAQALWSSWLIGCVTVYGLAPRALSLAISLNRARKHLARLDIDANLPAYANLRHRLQPGSENLGADTQAAEHYQAHIQPQHASHYDASQALLVGIELPPDTHWPPHDLAVSIEDLGIIDTRAQRKALLDRLQAQPPQKLLIVCDARQTPDRGTVALASDLASLAEHTHIALALAGDPDPRLAAWIERLAAAGFTEQHIHSRFATAYAWLQGLQDAPEEQHGAR
jgi:hypothetical protein